MSCRISPHATTSTPPCELFLKRTIRTRLDLIRPDLGSNISGKQSSHHDIHSRRREFFLGQRVMARNYREGPRWIAGTIAEKRGPLTYLVQIREDILWKRYIDQLIQAADTPDDVSSCASLPIYSNCTSQYYQHHYLYHILQYYRHYLYHILQYYRHYLYHILQYYLILQLLQMQHQSSRLQQIQCLLHYPLLLQLKLQHCHGDIPCDKIVVHLNDSSSLISLLQEGRKTIVNETMMNLLFVCCCVLHSLCVCLFLVIV